MCATVFLCLANKIFNFYLILERVTTQKATKPNPQNKNWKQRKCPEGSSGAEGKGRHEKVGD